MSESENNFESLRRLLALKRHEIPPPGYFNDFSREVILRIREGEANAPQGITAPSWLLRFFQAFEAKPAYISSFACSLCLLLVLGIVYAERPDTSMNPSMFGAIAAPTVSLADATAPVLSPATQPTGLMISTNPVLSLQPVASLFGQRNPLAEPVDFSVPGN